VEDHAADRAARGQAGIVTAGMLAVARAAGETAPLLFTALGNRFWSLRMDQPIATLPVFIYDYAKAPYTDWNRQAWTGALVLVLIVTVISLVLADYRPAGSRPLVFSRDLVGVVLDDPRLGHEDRLLRHIRRQVGHALQIPAREHQLERLGHRPRIVHHLRRELREDLGLERVDLGVALADTLGQGARRG
jgi:hypothetical protein